MKKLVFIFSFLFMHLISAANLVSISGTVFANGYSPITATITATNLTTNDSYTSTVNPNGTFKIDSMPTGDYKLYCTPINMMSNYFLETYYAQKPNPTDADIIPLQFPIINLELNLLEAFLTANDQKTTLETTNTSIYPNPFSTILSFENAEEDIVIYNALGQIQYKNQDSFGKIETSTWENGIYFVQIEKQMLRVLKN